MARRDPETAKSMINRYTNIITGLKTTYADMLAEGEFEKAADAQEKIAIAAARIVHLEEAQTAFDYILWVSENRKKFLAMIAVAFAMLIAIAGAIGGGIFAVVPGQTATGINGGAFVINKFMGDIYWCPPNGGCRAL